MPATARAKLSTTIAEENYRYLEGMVQSGRVRNLAEAVDLTIHRSRRAENRERLERATQAYFEGLSPEAEAEEDSLGLQLTQSVAGIDFDRE